MVIKLLKEAQVFLCSCGFQRYKDSHTLIMQSGINFNAVLSFDSILGESSLIVIGSCHENPSMYLMFQ